MTAAEKLAEMKLQVKQAEHSEKALKALQALEQMLENNDAHGLRIKANRANGSQEVVMIEDLGPGFEQEFFEAIHIAIEHHKEQLEEILGEGPEEKTIVLEAIKTAQDTAHLTPVPDGPQADPEHGPIEQTVAFFEKVGEAVKDGQDLGPQLGGSKY